MINYEDNRNTVQRGLDRRKAEREEARREEARRNAEQEAVDEAFWVGISRRAQTHRAEREAAEEAQRREEERKKAEARQRKQRAEREKRYCLYWYLYAFLTILPLLIATALIALHDIGWIPLGIMAPAGIACCVFSIFTFVDLAPWLDRETVKKFTTTFWRKFRAYMLTPYSKMIH